VQPSDTTERSFISLPHRIGDGVYVNIKIVVNFGCKSGFKLTPSVKGLI